MRLFTTGPASPGARLFAFVLGAVVLVMALGAAIVAADAFADGQVSIPVRRGRGRLSASGWRAYLYGVGMAAACLSFLSTGTAFAAAALLPSRLSRRALPLLAVGALLLVATGALLAVFTVAMLFD